MRKKIYSGMALDLIQTIDMEKHVPIVYCYITFDTIIDVDRMKQAVKRTAEIVPQILCRYDDTKNRWYPARYDINSVVKIFSGINCRSNMIWDLRTGPQLKINICRRNDSDSLQICMSHILTDGAGFRQYLALLCGFYNEHGSQAPSKVNRRSIMPLLYHTGMQRIWPSHNHFHKGNIPGLLPKTESDSQLPQSIKVTLSEEQLGMVKEKAKELHVTLNDIFMASYAYALKDFTLQDQIIIPCPTDLRKYDRRKNILTIANMTGKYLCQISLGYGLKETVLAVHKEMERLKSHYDCFHLVLPLQILHVILPSRILRIITKSWYYVEPTSYTNMGAIDERKVFFQGVSIKECYLCGTYRQAPSFQISISIYKNACTLSANMLGSQNQKIAGMRLLEEMKASLLYGF